MSSINDKVDRLIKKVHQKRILQAMDETMSKQIYNKLPNDDKIYEVDELIKWINENLGIEDIELIQRGIQKLIEDKKLLTADVRGNMYLQKNKFHTQH